MRQRIDMIGKKINHWTVLEKTERRAKDGMLYWKCQCDCGKIREVLGGNLRAGRCQQCGWNCPILLKNKINASFDKKYIMDKNDCWIWCGARTKGGYGKIQHCKTAHRFSYERFIGKIPEGMCVCHTCDNRSCVNPKHLWLGTTQDNTADKIAKGRQIRGERMGISKLKDIEVINIREMRLSGKTYKEIAEFFCVNWAMISLICRNKAWTHLPLGDKTKAIKRKY